MTNFPADPGTWLIDHDEDVPPVPIIGWCASGATATPILPVPAQLVSGQAYRLAGTGAVVDPAWPRTFESEEAWRATMAQAPYEIGQPISGKKTAAKPTTTKTAERKGIVASESMSSEVSAQIEWGKKSLKNNSFWQFSGDVDAVFIVPGGTLLPIGDNVDKVTRDKFYELRKEIPEVTVSPDDLRDDDDDDDSGDLI